MSQTATDQATYKTSENLQRRRYPLLHHNVAPCPCLHKMQGGAPDIISSTKLRKRTHERRLIFRQERGFRSLTMGKKGLRFF
jgi:hypothetical protein